MVSFGLGLASLAFCDKQLQATLKKQEKFENNPKTIKILHKTSWFTLFGGYFAIFKKAFPEYNFLPGSAGENKFAVCE